MKDVNQFITRHLDIWTSATEKKSGAGRGTGGGVSLYGIKKLRGLILELAVQGRLVPQLSSDRPAQELLAALGVSLKKNQKPPLKTGWAWASLTDLGEFFGGMTPSKGKPAYWGRGMPWVSPKDMKSLEIASAEDEVTETALSETNLKVAPPKSLLMVTRSGILKRKFPVSINTFECVVNQDLKVLVPKDTAMSQYLQLMLRGFQKRILNEFVKSGMTVQSVTFKEFTQAVWPIPPLTEQRRIVAKVDELMGLCDALERQAKDSLEAHQTLVEVCLSALTTSKTSKELAENWSRLETHFDTLFTTEESVEGLRRAVLNLALRGLLTDQREGVAPASDLLEKLYAKNKKSASSRHRTIVSKIKKSEPPFDLPKSWAWSNLGLLSSDLRYGTSKKCDRDDSLVPVLRIPNVSGGKVDFDDMKYGPLDPREVADLRLRSNDLLIIRSNGSLDIVGSFAVVPELNGDFAFAGYLVRVRIDPTYVDPRYIWYVSMSRFLRDQIEGPIRHGVGLKNVNSTELASLQFPIPPREEQKRILDKLDDLFELCDQFANRVRDSNTINLTLAETLTSKIH